MILSAIGFLVVCLVGGAMSPNLSESLQRAGSFVLLFVLGNCLVWAAPPLESARSMFKGFMIVSVLACGIGLVSSLGNTAYGERYGLFHTNPNWTAGVVGVGFVFFSVSWAYCPRKSSLRGLALGLGALGSLFLIYRTGSRGSLASAGLALLVGSIFWRPVRKTMIIALAVTAGLFAVTWLTQATSINDAVGGYLLRGAESGDITAGRIDDVRNLEWDYFLESSLVGTGLGGGSVMGLTDVGFAAFLGRCGILGSVAMSIWIVATVRSFVRADRRLGSLVDKGTHRDLTVMGIVFVFFTGLNCFEAYILSVGNIVTPMVWIIAGLASSLANNCTRTAPLHVAP